METSPPPTRPLSQVDIAILTIRPDELHAVLAAFPDDPDLFIGRRHYNLRTANAGGGRRYRVAILRQVEQGNGEALDAARDAIAEVRPRLLLVVGIAGGVPHDDFTLGDVVVATRVNEYSVEARKMGEQPTYALAGGPVDLRIAASVVNLPAREADLEGWTDSLPEQPPVPLNESDAFYGPEAWKQELRRSLSHHFGDGHKRIPRYKDGVIASSDRLIKDPAVLFPWLLTARQLLAVEMESGGVYRAARDRAPMLAIRGISDIIGLRRDDRWTKYACATAAAFTRAYLRTTPIPPIDDLPPEPPPGSEPAEDAVVMPCSGSADDDEIQEYLLHFARGMRERCDQRRGMVYIPLRGALLPPASPPDIDYAGVRPTPAAAIQRIRDVSSLLASANDQITRSLARLSPTIRRVRNVARELASTERPLVLLGDPGSGKSMTLWMLGETLARKQVGRQHPTLITYVRLGAWTTAPTPASVVELIRSSIPERYSGVKASLETLIAKRRLVILFDGVDEMRRGSYGERIALLSRFAHEHVGRIKVIFSCRINDYLPDLDHEQIVIGPLDKLGMFRFIRHSMSFPILVDDQECGLFKFFLSVLENKNLLDLIANPLLLSLFCAFVRDRGVFPDSAGALFEHSIKSMVRKQDQVSGAANLAELNQLRMGWSELAYRLMLREGAMCVDTAALREILGSEAPRLVEVGSACGILAVEHEQGGSVSFFHRRIHEYLAARFIAERDPEPCWSRLLDRAQWQETLTFLATMRAPRALLEELTASLGETGLAVGNVEAERRASERMVLASMFLRRSPQTADLDPLARVLHASVRILAERGRPISQVKALIACEHLHDAVLQDVVGRLCRSDISFVRDRALRVAASQISADDCAFLSEAIALDSASLDLGRRLWTYWRIALRHREWIPTVSWATFTSAAYVGAIVGWATLCTAIIDDLTGNAQPGYAFLPAGIVAAGLLYLARLARPLVVFAAVSVPLAGICQTPLSVQTVWLWTAGLLAAAIALGTAAEVVTSGACAIGASWRGPSLPYEMIWTRMVSTARWRSAASVSLGLAVGALVPLVLLPGVVDPSRISARILIATEFVLLVGAVALRWLRARASEKAHNLLRITFLALCSAFISVAAYSYPLVSFNLLEKQIGAIGALISAVVPLFVLVWLFPQLRQRFIRDRVAGKIASVGVRTRIDDHNAGSNAIVADWLAAVVKVRGAFQASLIWKLTRPEVRLAPMNVLRALRDAEPHIGRDPAASAYWEAIDEMEQRVRLLDSALDEKGTDEEAQAPSMWQARAEPVSAAVPWRAPGEDAADPSKKSLRRIRIATVLALLVAASTLLLTANWLVLEAWAAGHFCQHGVSDACVLAGAIGADRGEAPERVYLSFRKACDSNVALACTWAADMHSSGQWAPGELGRMIELYARACDLNDPSGCDNLGRLYESGEGVEKNVDMALDFYKKSCDLAPDTGCLHRARILQAEPDRISDPAEVQRLVKRACVRPKNDFAPKELRPWLKEYCRRFNGGQYP